MFDIIEGDFYKTNKGHVQVISHNPLEAWGITGVTDKGVRVTFDDESNGVIKSTTDLSDPDCIIFINHLTREEYPEMYL